MFFSHDPTYRLGENPYTVSLLAFLKEWLGLNVRSEDHLSSEGHAEHVAIALIPTLARRNLSPSLHVLLSGLILRTTAVVDRRGPAAEPRFSPLGFYSAGAPCRPN